MSNDVLRWSGNDTKQWLLVKASDRYGVADKDGNLICAIKYLSIKPFVDGLAAIRFKKNIFSKEQAGVINEKGEETLFSPEYLDIKILNRNMIAAKVQVSKKECQWCLIKKTGERICQPKYDCFPDRIGNTEFWKAAVNGHFTLIDAKGHQLCKPIYDDISWAEGYLQGLKKHYWYKMNKQGVELNCRPREVCYTTEFIKKFYS